MPSSILNSDDGVISGTSGLKNSGGDDGELAVQSNGTEVAKFKTTELVINDGGANYDFRVEGDTDANLLFVDASADRVGIGTSSPSTKVQSVINSGAEWTSSELLSGTTNIQFVDLFLQNLDTSITGTETSLLMSSGGSGGAQHSLTVKRTASNLGDLIFRRRTGASTSAESMRLDSSGNLQFNSGYGSVATAYGCRAWVNFNGTGTVAIREDGNVSSITDNGTGDYTVNFTTAMPDANFCVGIAAQQNTGSSRLYGSVPVNSSYTWNSSSSIRVTFINQATAVANDPLHCCVSIFR
jgi:hypothetical protein